MELVRLTLLAGDPLGGASQARAAQRSFAAQRRSALRRARGWLGAGRSDRRRRGPVLDVRSGRHAAATLAAAGWTQEALRVRLSVARAAIELGDAAGRGR